MPRLSLRCTPNLHKPPVGLTVAAVRIIDSWHCSVGGAKQQHSTLHWTSVSLEAYTPGKVALELQDQEIRECRVPELNFGNACRLITAVLLQLPGSWPARNYQKWGAPKQWARWIRGLGCSFDRGVSPRDGGHKGRAATYTQADCATRAQH